MRSSLAFAVASHAALVHQTSAAAVKWNLLRGRDDLGQGLSSSLSPSLPPTMSAPFGNLTTSSDQLSMSSSSTSDASSSQSMTVPTIIETTTTSRFSTTLLTSTTASATTAVETSMSTPTNSLIDSTASSSVSCTPWPTTHLPTWFDVVHTATITIYENQTADYQPPYDPIFMPTYCAPPPIMFPGPDDDSAVGELPEATKSSAIPGVPPFQPTFTFVTTDSNPSVVVLPTETPPEYGSQSDGDAVHDPGVHRPPAFVITASGQQVIINHATFSNLGLGDTTTTTTVTVDGGTFTISPSAVVGEGGSVFRPPFPGGILTASLPSPLETEIGGLPIFASGSVIVIDDTTLTVPPEGLSTTIGGQDVFLGPGTVSAAGHVVTWAAASNDQVQQPTNIVVAGGELLTVVGGVPGVVVVHSTTITYGPYVAETSEIIVAGDETVAIGPSGVVVHDSTLGGPSLAPSSTEYEVVGGVTMTQIGTTIVVIDGITYTLGTGEEPVTTSIHGLLVIIGPDQVTVANNTFGGTTPTPDAVVVSTIEPTGTWLDNYGYPQETGGDSGGDEEDGAVGLYRSSFSAVWLSLAMGVLILI